MIKLLWVVFKYYYDYLRYNDRYKYMWPFKWIVALIILINWIHDHRKEIFK
jgi:hypothetical protein